MRGGFQEEDGKRGAGVVAAGIIDEGGSKLVSRLLHQ